MGSLNVFTWFHRISAADVDAYNGLCDVSRESDNSCASICMESHNSMHIYMHSMLVYVFNETLCITCKIIAWNWWSLMKWVINHNEGAKNEWI